MAIQCSCACARIQCGGVEPPSWHRCHWMMLGQGGTQWWRWDSTHIPSGSPDWFCQRVHLARISRHLAHLCLVWVSYSDASVGRMVVLLLYSIMQEYRRTWITLCAIRDNLYSRQHLYAMEALAPCFSNQWPFNFHFFPIKEKLN